MSEAVVFVVLELVHQASYRTMHDNCMVVKAWCGLKRTTSFTGAGTWHDDGVRFGFPTGFRCIARSELHAKAKAVMRDAAGEDSPGYKAFLQMEYGQHGIPYE